MNTLRAKVISESARKGTYHRDNANGILADLFANDSWQLGMPVLFDNCRADFNDVNYKIVSDASFRFAANNERLGQCRIASLVASPLGFDVSRQFQALMAEKSRGG